MLIVGAILEKRTCSTPWSVLGDLFLLECWMSLQTQNVVKYLVTENLYGDKGIHLLAFNILVGLCKSK